MAGGQCLRWENCSGRRGFRVVNWCDVRPGGRAGPVATLNPPSGQPCEGHHIAQPGGLKIAADGLAGVAAPDNLMATAQLIQRVGVPAQNLGSEARGRNHGRRHVAWTCGREFRQVTPIQFVGPRGRRAFGGAAADSRRRRRIGIKAATRAIPPPFRQPAQIRRAPQAPRASRGAPCAPVRLRQVDGNFSHQAPTSAMDYTFAPARVTENGSRR